MSVFREGVIARLVDVDFDEKIAAEMGTKLSTTTAAAVDDEETGTGRPIVVLLLNQETLNFWSYVNWG